MGRFVATGALISIVIGFIAQFVFPDLFNIELAYKILFRKQAQIPTYPQAASGSVFAVGILTPTIFGIIGGAFGVIVYKLKK